MEKTYKAIYNAQIVLENGILCDGALLIDGNRILEYGNAREMESRIPGDTIYIDAKGSYVGPGFVDIHVHGGGGYSTCYEPVEASNYFLRHGTTSILATTDYHMPFEGDEHHATLMLLPYRKDTWREGGVPAREAYKNVV